MHIILFCTVVNGFTLVCYYTVMLNWTLQKHYEILYICFIFARNITLKKEIKVTSDYIRCLDVLAYETHC